MKLYNLLILTKNTNKSKKKIETSQQYTALYTTYSHVLDGKIKIITTNWCLIVRT